MTEKTYTSSCHCGAMKIEATFNPNDQPAMMCNCSICSRTGNLMRFLPESAVKVVAAGTPTDYQFNKKNIHHLFCSTCGIRPWGYGTGGNGQYMYMINLRCLEDFDPRSVEVKYVDGKSL